METQVVAALVRSLVLALNSPQSVGYFSMFFHHYPGDISGYLVGFYEVCKLSAQLGFQQRMLLAQ